MLELESNNIELAYPSQKRTSVYMVLIFSSFPLNLTHPSNVILTKKSRWFSVVSELADDAAELGLS